MLLSLTVKNFIIVEHLTLHFNDGFNVLTGETGAGKSILIDAVSLVLGGKADSGEVRSGASQAEITATFDMAKLRKVYDWLSQNGLALDDGALLIRRCIDLKGRSRHFINHQAVTLSQLKAIGEYLVDIHGQQMHQSLVRADTQRLLLDAYAGATSLACDVAEAWHAWRDAMEARQNAEQNASKAEEERAELTATIQEMVDLGLECNEWETLNARHHQLAHARELIEATQESLSRLAEDDPHCLTLLSQAQNALNKAAKIDERLLESESMLESASVSVKETAHHLRQYLNRLDEDPDKLVQVENRMRDILSMARKYHVQPEALFDMLNTLQARLTALDVAVDVASLIEKEKETKAVYDQLAQKLTQQRTKAAKTLAEKVVAHMQFLMMPDARFEIQLMPLTTPTAYGLESIDYQVAINIGTALRPLAKVASGGELSRMSLAIQVVMSEVSPIPTLIFDEIDAGVGGGVAETIGQLLKNLGCQHQVFVITHLPQVAVYGKHHWQVSKTQRHSDHSVHVSVQPLTDDERVQEIARMLGGLQITEVTQRHAEEMLSIGLH